MEWELNVTNKSCSPYQKIYQKFQYKNFPGIGSVFDPPPPSQEAKSGFDFRKFSNCPDFFYIEIFYSNMAKVGKKVAIKKSVCMVQLQFSTPLTFGGDFGTNSETIGF